ncbi:MAG: potassium channel family protein, partial [Truepera sp.]|nr:potassium channel family protein [Truepera sp.]
TVTTVGYGDVTPVTAVGRIVATVLMFGGIGLFGALTANLASFIVRSDNRDSANQQLLEEVRLLRSQVARLEEP